MKRNQVIFLIFIGGLLIISQGCKKGSTHEDYSYALSRHALEFVNLTRFNYLIYKDSATSLLDSVIITTSELKSNYSPASPDLFSGLPAYYYETYNLVLTKYTASSYVEWLRASTYIYVNYPLIITDTIAVDLRDTDNTPLFYLSNSDPANFSMMVEGKIYNNVVVTTYENGVDINAPGYKKSICYWAKGTGIIKRTVITTGGIAKTYTLLRNN